MTASSKQSSDLRVPFGRRGDSLVGPADVLEKGLACDCVCPGCGAPLLTRQGSKRRHFAHYNAPGSALCVRQSIHAAAIQVLLRAKRLAVPAMMVSVREHSKSFSIVQRSQELRPQGMVDFDACAHEVTFSNPEFGTIRPDVVGYHGDSLLLVEICFTHAVDAEKLLKVERYGHPMLEIDVADLNLEAGMAALEKRVLEEVAYKQWLFYPGTTAIVQELTEEVREEIKWHDDKYERERARARSKAEFRSLQEQRVRLQAKKAYLLRLAAVQEKIEIYRQKPVHEKVDAIRRRLSIPGTWPNFLRRAHYDNDAIDAPAKLWQAAAFHRFVFNRSSKWASFDSGEVTSWVLDWFGRVSKPGLDPNRAVLAFLIYLKGCGFLRYGGSHDGHHKYIVVHDGLVPPERKPEQEANKPIPDAPQPQPILGAQDRTGLASSDSIFGWKPVWPEYDMVRVAVSKWLSMSQQDELTLLYVLYECRNDLPSPTDFALMMRDEVPLANVLQFLRSHDFIE